VAHEAARRLRVLMVTPRFLPLLGGVEMHVDQVARRLVERGADVSVLTTDTTGELATNEHRDGFEVRRVRAWPARRDFYLAPGLYREISASGCDICHVQSFHTFVAPIAMHAALRAELPYVVTFHAGGHSSRGRALLRPLQLAAIRPLLARADRLIALARFEVEEYTRRLRLAREHFVVIPNGSDLPISSAGSSVAREAALIATVGRLERYKGHHLVLRALPHVLQIRPDARLRIIGSGPYEDTLRGLAERLGVGNQVGIVAVPPQERGRMASELARVAVMVSLSEYETQPLAALEALAAGCRLVVADTPGLRSLGEDGLARVVKLDSSPPDLASAILEELERPPVFHPPALPTWDDCADSLLELYDSVVAG
jgi:glycosyltransferase involved in cell wall biosynthesis